MEIQNKKIMVIGAGKSGKETVKVLNNLGYNVAIQDKAQEDDIDPKFLAYIEKECIVGIFGDNNFDPCEYDLLVVSPGVPLDLPFIKSAKLNGIDVIGELELAYLLSHGSYIGITGTNGKTTTTTLVGEIFKNSGKNTKVVGNIGVPAISVSVKSEEDDIFVTEISSFQLESINTFRPKIAAILNITPDHLNRHKTFEAYVDAKSRIFMNQTENDYLIINWDDPCDREISKKAKSKIIPFSRRMELDFGVYISDNTFVVRDEQGIKHEICKLNDLKIIGEHNMENALAAIAISYFGNVDKDIIAKTIRSFKGVEHRLEYVGNVDKVDFYNDSKGTNLDATLTAIKALKNNIILIAGGDAKSQDFSPLGAALETQIKALVLIGRDKEMIEKVANASNFKEVYKEKDMNEAVLRAVSIAESGDKVLLSPACASWDMYDNYEQRGRHFKESVNRLLK